MKHIRDYIYSIAYACGYCGIRYLFRSWVWSPILGGARLSLGLHHSILPATLGYTGPVTSLITLLMEACYRIPMAGTLCVWLRMLPLGTCMASLYISVMTHASRRLRILTATVYTIAGWSFFAIYPHDPYMMLYTIYWFIPIIGAMYAHRSVFLMMLGATFTAHIAGSCIWLATTSLATSTWTSLIPRVALERMTCAACMTLIYEACHHAQMVRSYMHDVYNAMRKQICLDTQR